MFTNFFELFVFAGQATPTVFDYFIDSNGAGKVIIVILMISSLIAWTLMLAKGMELGRIDRANLKLEKEVRDEGVFLDIDLRQLAKKKSAYSTLLVSAVQAYNRYGEVDVDRERSKRMSQVENALQRNLSSQTLEYESRMVMLATIVTGAPFAGLLGTVWGVMDAFGGVAAQGTATLRSLAPGVSGALLTTVMGLLVALPSVIGYNALLSRIRSMTMKLENFASTVADRIELEDRY